jgi:hypothetical protein
MFGFTVPTRNQITCGFLVRGTKWQHRK